MQLTEAQPLSLRRESCAEQGGCSVINPLAFANAMAVTTAGLAFFLMVLRLFAPPFFVCFFNAQFFGADVASLLPAEPRPLVLIEKFLALLAGAWLIGFVWVSLSTAGRSRLTAV